MTIFSGLVTLLLAYWMLGSYNPDSEKVSAYECGFDPYEDARNEFDVHFYLVAIMFILFDLEAVFFFPWCVSVGLLSYDGIIGMIDFVYEILFGLMYAWAVGALKWK